METSIQGLDIVYDALSENDAISGADKLVLGEYILSAIQHCTPKNQETNFGYAMKGLALSLGWETYCALWVGTGILLVISLLVNVYMFGRLRRMKVYRNLPLLACSFTLEHKQKDGKIFIVFVYYLYLYKN